MAALEGVAVAKKTDVLHKKERRSSLSMYQAKSRCEDRCQPFRAARWSQASEPDDSLMDPYRDK
jgi:hypothetical protein